MSHDPAMAGLLHVSAALAVIVLAAQVCGALARRLRQPAVVGEMLSGVLLGPSLLGWAAPAAGDYLFSAGTKPVLYAVAMVGLSLYMFLVGAAHRHPDGSGREAALPVVLGVVGLVVPVVAGGAAAVLVTDDLRPAGVSTWEYALFVGGALSVAAFPMLARVLQERDMVGTRFGRVATSAAAVDDALAWCLLAVSTALVVRGTVAGALLTIVPALVMVLLAFTVLPRLLRRPMEHAVRHGLGDGLLAGLLVLVLAVGWLSDYIGIYSVFGGFVCGAALPRVRGFSALLDGACLRLVRCLMLPVFFAYSGLNTDLRTVFSGGSLFPLLVLLAVAIAAKSGAAYAVLRGLFGWSPGEAVAMGSMMNARGLMILIFINAGLTLGLIGTELFSMLVVVAVVTTALAVPGYRRHFTPEVEHRARRDAAPAEVPAPLMEAA